MRLKRTALISLVLLLLVVGVFGLWMHAQQRQYTLNRQLIEALVHNDDKLALKLVNEGADPNTCYKPTPAPSLPEIVKRMLHRLPPTVNDSPTAFLIVCGAQVYSGGKLVRSNGSDNAPLTQAMLKHGAYVNARYASSVGSGETALLLASLNNHQNTAAVLLEHGASINAQDDYGRTPLIGAANVDAADVTRLLLEHGAEVNAKDYSGRTPLTGAAYNNALDIVRLLLEHRADTNAKDKDSNTPLINAAMKDASPEVIRLLLEHGAEVNARDKDGGTPLMLAAMHGASPEVVRLLLQHGAEVNVKDKDGQTPLMNAAAYASPYVVEVVRLLLEHKADANAKDNSGQTPLMLAKGHPDIIALLKQAGARK